ncbi:MAG: VWA domain-containing protein [Myxococcales bacterium]|nr:VWA domain-containing protein [Myxococcales bacterium]
MKRSILGFVGLGLVFAASTGCDAGTGAEDGGGGEGAGNSSGTGSPNGSTGDGFATGSTGSGVGGGCAGIDKTAEKVPLDIYIMLDQSGSMSDPPSMGGGTKWDAVSSALSTFVNQPEAAGIGVGIQYFPLDSGANCNVLQCNVDGDCGAGCGPCEGFGGFGICSGYGASDSCLVTDYATPDVEIATLPGNANAIIQSIGNHGPTGGTPTSAALEGAISHAQTWANANPGHAVIVVLATDGDPTSCNSDLAYINGVAAAGFGGTPSIRTFVIGVGGSVSALNGFAAAGGTGSAFMIDQDPNVQQAFLDALNQIQGIALPCSYLIPAPDQGEINYQQVNVQYTPGGGGTPQTLPKVSGLADCPPGGNAWYYDNEAMPTQIVLCPDTCTNLSQDTMGQIKIVLGCDTVVQ